MQVSTRDPTITAGEYGRNSSSGQSALETRPQLLAHTRERWYNKTPESPDGSRAMTAPNRLDNIVVVLCRPQKLVNIAGTIRAMKNMGLSRLRLVRPAEFDPADIEGIAHRSADVLTTMTLHASLDDALADALYVAGTTGRTRELVPRNVTPREIAPELLLRAEQGPI